MILQPTNQTKQPTALVTGSTGFIGRHLVKALTDQQFNIVTIPHEYLYDLDWIKQKAERHQPDYIFHLSSYGNMHDQTNEDEIFSANVLATMNLLQATKDIPYTSFINVSSSSVTLDRQTMYSATKLAAEALCRAFVDTYHKPIMSVRPYSVYGPGESDERFIPTVFRSCLTNEPMTLSPDATHDWIYVTDVVNYLIDEFGREKPAGQTYDLGTQTSQTNLAVVTLIEQITGKAANIKQYKRLRSFDTTDWKAKYPLRGARDLTAGLKLCHQYYYEKYVQEKN